MESMGFVPRTLRDGGLKKGQGNTRGSSLHSRYSLILNFQMKTATYDKLSIRRQLFSPLSFIDLILSNSQCNTCNWIEHVLDRNQMVTVINALVFSKLLYCSTVWSNTSNKNIHRLQSVQNFAARIITGTRKFNDITPVLRDLCWLPVKQKLFFCDTVMAFKCKTGQAPHYLSDQFTTRLVITRRVT